MDPINIEYETINNVYFRNVIHTSLHSQLVLMSLNREIGMEIHPDNDQFIKIEQGNGIAFLNGVYYQLFAGVSVSIPAGTQHNIYPIGNDPLKLYTIYSPPLHPHGEIIY